MQRASRLQIETNDASEANASEFVKFFTISPEAPFRSCYLGLFFANCPVSPDMLSYQFRAANRVPSEGPRLFRRAAMHALRHVPADMPDVRRDEAGAQQPARSYRSHARHCR